MKRILLPAIAATFVAGPALSETAVIVYDMELTEQFEAKRDIVDMVQELYGETAVYSTGDDVPEALIAKLNPKSPLPYSNMIEPVPAPLAGKLPHTIEDSRWVKVGDHLVEVDNDGDIVMTVYDVLR